VTLNPVTAYTAACNACGEVLEDEDGGTLFTDPVSATAAASAYGWTILGDQHLCPTQDATHQKFIDQAMPPESAFQAPGQLTIGEE
jgi:hypothetical protein